MANIHLHDGEQLRIAQDGKNIFSLSTVVFSRKILFLPTALWSSGLEQNEGMTATAIEDDIRSAHNLLNKR